MQKLLLGDEALALGAINAGISGVYAYPGTPSTEITEYIQANAPQIRSRWCTNEKTAMEAALGMSYAGKRALVCMKHVGMNVCADAFINSAITGVNGGLVVVAADDPSMHSSQNEQDSRFYAQFAMVPLLEPSNQQQTYDLIQQAFDLSEEVHLPVVIRMVTRLAHSRAGIETVSGKTHAENSLNPAQDKGWVLLPAIAKKQYIKLIEKQSAIAEASERAASVEYHPNNQSQKNTLGIVACGIAYNYVREALSYIMPKSYSILRINQYPLPVKAIKELGARCEAILVVEDGQPFAEQAVAGILGPDYKVYGRLEGTLPRTGELNPDNIANSLRICCSFPDGMFPEQVYPQAENLRPRPPQLCPGCGHRDVFTALNKVVADYPQARIFGDIGCYTLGALPPFKALASCVDMGASITMAKGAADAGLFPAIAVIGDSTFTHSGITGLLDAVNDRANITVIISDNLTTAMTGGQDSAGTSKYEAICLSIGVEPEHLHVVLPLPANLPAIEEIIRKEIEYKGVSVIIPRRECMHTLARRKKKH